MPDRSRPPLATLPATELPVPDRPGTAPAAFIHPSAIVEAGADVGPACLIWHHCHVRSGARLGNAVSCGKDVYIDVEVAVGDNTRIQNGVSVYRGVHLAPWVFVGPNATFTNDRLPRAGSRDWEISETFVETGASIGAGTTIVAGVTIGAFAMIGAGAVVTRSIPPFRLALGCPARAVLAICACGRRRWRLEEAGAPVLLECCRGTLHPELYQIASQMCRRPPERPPLPESR